MIEQSLKLQPQISIYMCLNLRKHVLQPVVTKYCYAKYLYNSNENFLHNSATITIVSCCVSGALVGISHLRARLSLHILK